MKKIVFFLTIFILILSCKENESKKSEEKQSTEKLQQSEKSIQITLNRNVETIGILLDLSDMGDYILKSYSKDYSLIKLYREEFNDYKKHPAVLKLNEFGESNLLHFGWYYYGLSFSELPEYKQINPRFEEFYLNENFSKEETDKMYREFDSLVKIFYKEADIESFISKNKSFYNKILAETKQVVPNTIIAEMENFFGSFNNQYTICPSPTIFTNFNFGPSVTTEDSKTYYYLTGPAYDISPQINSLANTAKMDSLGFNDKEYVTELAIHEFGHSFVRFLDKENKKNSIAELAYLNTDELKENLDYIGEGVEWSNGFEEHLVRASEIMVWRRMGNENLANEKLSFELNKEGLLYINEFVKSLENFENNRNEYKTLESYFPQLIEDLKKI